MLTEEQFEQWCYRNHISEQSKQKIQEIRFSDPSRRVGNNPVSVTGRYPSQKLKCVQQFESRSGELPYIYRLEYDPNVLEYYDQPPAIELNYDNRNGHHVTCLHTPDFFVIWADGSAGYVECKQESHLQELAQKRPARYQLENGQWRCPPGEESASRFQLGYTLHSSAQLNSVFERNCRWLEDYWVNVASIEVDPEATETVKSAVENEPGISLEQLKQQLENVSVDELHWLIAKQEIYVDLERDLLNQPEQARVFLDEEVAYAHMQIYGSDSSEVSIAVSLDEIEVNTQLSWDGQPWIVVNKGNESIILEGENQEFQEIPKATFSQFLQQEKITCITSNWNYVLSTEAQEIYNRASKQDLAQANRRYREIVPFLFEISSTPANRTQRRYLEKFRQAEKDYGRGYLGLLPKHYQKGNHHQKRDEQVLELAQQHIKDCYETAQQPSIRHVYYHFREQCEEQGYSPLSFERYRQLIRDRQREDQTRQRQGPKAAYQEQFLDFYTESSQIGGSYYLQQGTPVHGERPFEIAHTDHTQAPIELVSSIMIELGIEDLEKLKKEANLGRPWVSLLTDAYSRRILAVYITYDPPSYYSNMMLLRTCIQRFGRLPKNIVVDGGADFRSEDFETLLAYCHITKIERPNSKPRHGSVIESLFGTSDDQFWHNLQGNTQLTKNNVRQVTKQFNPKFRAIWTLDKIYFYFCQYCYEVYDTCRHQALRMEPCKKFNIGMAKAGLREHLKTSEEEFKLVSMPTPKANEGKRKITQKGIKIHYLYYKHPSFKDFRGNSVDTKYDPFDITTAYAYVDGEWVTCRSEHIQELEGRSYKQIEIASEELKALNSLQTKQFQEINGRKLAQFFNRIEREEAVLSKPWRQAKKKVEKQQLQDQELKRAWTTDDAESSVNEVNSEETSSENSDSLVDDTFTTSSSPSQIMFDEHEDEDEDSFENLEPIEEEYIEEYYKRGGYGK